jgi:hypothetical protein
MEVCKRLAKKRKEQADRIMNSTYEDFDVVFICIIV